MTGAGGGVVKCVLILDSMNSNGLQFELAFSDLGGDDEIMDAEGAGGT